jgi:glutaredoxin
LWWAIEAVQPLTQSKADTTKQLHNTKTTTMGRITIFSIDECPHCVRAKEALKQRNIPYLEISLSKFPKKRNDMLSLSDRLTVPQIFVNDQHIGGADDTLKLLEQWDNNSKGLSPLEMYKNLVASEEDPTDPRLQPSTEPPVVELPPPPRTHKFIEVPYRKQTVKMSVLYITEVLKSIVSREDLAYNVTVYRNAFTGRELISALECNFQLIRPEALSFARDLQQKHSLFHHVTNDHIIQDTDNLFFRLQADHTPNILNSYRIWNERVDPSPMALLKRLKNQLNAILRDHTNDKGKIDYIAACKHKDFPVFEEAVCELQGVDYASMNHHLKLSFSINLYNMMIKYAFTKVGIGADIGGRSAFFSRVGFQLGGANGTRKVVLTFQDLENGVLRSNRRAPHARFRQFSKDDDRCDLVLDHVDSRIHFGLNCGASSCPPVKNFTEDGIVEELRIVARAFCEDGSNVRVEGNTLYLNKILYWYGEDFGGSSAQTAEAVLGFLQGSAKAAELKCLIASGKMRVKFNDYDWSTDASQAADFSGYVVKADHSRLVKLHL